VPGAGVEPARDCSRGILSPLRLPIPPPGQCGGWGRNRTGVHGFAGRCITTLPPSQGADDLIVYRRAQKFNVISAIPAKNGENGFLDDLLRENKFPLAVREENHDSPP
jgi:hypothetical protein